MKEQPGTGLTLTAKTTALAPDGSAHSMPRGTKAFFLDFCQYQSQGVPAEGVQVAINNVEGHPFYVVPAANVTPTQ